MKQVILLAFAILSGTICTYSQTMKEWRDSLDVINKQLANTPSSTDLLLCKAAVNLQLLNWDDAIDACRKVLDNDNSNLSALFYRAYANNSLRRYDLAKNDYERLVSMAPDNLEARLGLAYTYVKLERQRDALDQLNNLVEMHPDSSIVYAARAELEKDMKQYDIALFDFDEALKRDPANRECTISKVEILLMSNRRREAKEALDKAVSSGVPRGLLLEWYDKCKE